MNFFFCPMPEDFLIHPVIPWHLVSSHLFPFTLLSLTLFSLSSPPALPFPSSLPSSSLYFLPFFCQHSFLQKLHRQIIPDIFVERVIYRTSFDFYCFQKISTASHMKSDSVFKYIKTIKIIYRSSQNVTKICFKSFF